MPQAFMLLELWNGRPIDDWRELIGLLRMIDDTIKPDCNWYFIRRNFFNNYDIYMDIVDGKFIFRQRKDYDKMKTYEELLEAYRLSKYWTNELSYYELTHTAEETYHYVRKVLCGKVAEELLGEANNV